MVTPSDLGISRDVEETGDTYEENSAIKARAFASASGLLTLADDSGLEVDALGGAPGVRSARYSATGSDGDNVDLLLNNLSGVPDDARTARFVSVVAVAGPSGEVEFCRGECEGAIARERRGEGGFGYDPVFLPSGTRRDYGPTTDGREEPHQPSCPSSEEGHSPDQAPT